MVQSLLNPSINYPESKQLEKNDTENESSIYDLEIFETLVTIAVGQPKYTYVGKNIVHYPIYLMKNNEVELQIGVYEVEKEKVPLLMDADGDINIALLNAPLFYAFVDKPLIQSIYVPMIDKANTNADEKAEVALEFEKMPLNEQTAADAAAERAAYNEKDKSLIWIQHYMQNKYYGIVENEKGGECLFAVIRDGLKTVGRDISVAEMRKMLAAEVTSEMLQIYTTLYENAKIEETELSAELKTLAARHKELKEKIKTTKERTAQAAIILHAEEVEQKHKEIKRARESTKEMVTEFAFMKGVTDVAKLKAKIQTCVFWGNTWAISTLERLLNIKLIILSEEFYNSDDIAHVLQCGQLNDEILEKSGNFTPSHYILANHQGRHYQLITYKAYGAFTFRELPYDIKKLIVEKCLERLAGPYYIIPDFRALYDELKMPAVALSTPINTIAKEAVGAKEEPLQSDLYTKGTVFQFYEHSTDKPAPGMGAGETLGPEGVKAYDELKKHVGWRKMLADGWSAAAAAAPFTLDGHQWLSVEHYYQGSKFKKTNPAYYLQFSLDSKTELAKNVEMAKSAGSKSGKYQGKLLRPASIQIDTDFFSGLRQKTELKNAMMAKFSQDAHLKQMLLATKTAKLTQYVRGSPPKISDTLMEVRKAFF